MPTTYTNRVVTIVIVLWVALSAIYPRVPGSILWLFNPTGPVSTHHALKPGIDMVGGTSLTYEIKQPEGSAPRDHLAEEVATSLKQRVDPEGVAQPDLAAAGLGPAGNPDAAHAAERAGQERPRAIRRRPRRARSDERPRGGRRGRPGDALRR